MLYDLSSMNSNLSAKTNRLFKTSSLVALSLIACVTFAETIEGIAVNVADGDTLALVVSNKSKKIIRLAGIDAPEKIQDFGPQSKQKLTELCLHKLVKAEVRSIDRYGRSVARIHCDDVNVATQLLQAGLAWHFTKYAKTQPEQEAEDDRLAQESAKSSGIGLWSMTDPIAPWDWRAMQHRKAAP